MGQGSFSTEAILWGCLLSPWGCPVRTAPFLDGLGPTGDFFRRLLQEISSLEKQATLADVAHLEAGRAPRAIRRGRWGRHLSLTCRTGPDRSSPRFKDDPFRVDPSRDDSSRDDSSRSIRQPPPGNFERGYYCLSLTYFLKKTKQENVL